jgi:hypothetical protein
MLLAACLCTPHTTHVAAPTKEGIAHKIAPQGERIGLMPGTYRTPI